MSKRVVASAVALGLVLLGGRGAGTASAVATTRARVKVVDNAFMPGRLRVHRGTRVKWVHKGGNPHTTTSDSGLWDESLSPGETFSRRFNKKGRFPYHCEIHSEMHGVIRVVA